MLRWYRCPFVAAEHATGELMGMSAALPKDADS